MKESEKARDTKNYICNPETGRYIKRTPANEKKVKNAKGTKKCVDFTSSKKATKKKIAPKKAGKKTCNPKTKPSDLFICNPITGRWVGSLSATGKKLLEEMDQSEIPERIAPLIEKKSKTKKSPKSKATKKEPPRTKEGCLEKSKANNELHICDPEKRKWVKLDSKKGKELAKKLIKEDVKKIPVKTSKGSKIKKPPQKKDEEKIEEYPDWLEDHIGRAEHEGEGGIEDLKEIYIDDSDVKRGKNRDKQLDFSILKNHKNIKDITVVDFGITKFVKGTTDLTDLEKLIFSGNKIRTIPKNIKKLKNLKELNLNDNEIKELPEEILKLKHLEQLNVSLNKIEELPEEIGNLKNLKILDIGDNNIKKLPKSIVKLKNLKTISLAENPLNKESLKLLEKLDVKNLIVYVDRKQDKKIPESLKNKFQLYRIFDEE